MFTLRARTKFQLAGLPVAVGATIESRDLTMVLSLMHQRLAAPKDDATREAIARAIEQYEAGFGARVLPREPAGNNRTSKEGYA